MSGKRLTCDLFIVILVSPLDYHAEWVGVCSCIINVRSKFAWATQNDGQSALRAVSANLALTLCVSFIRALAKIVRVRMVTPNPISESYWGFVGFSVSAINLSVVAACLGACRLDLSFVLLGQSRQCSVGCI